jgi:hypothetical protein
VTSGVNEGTKDVRVVTSAVNEGAKGVRVVTSDVAEGAKGVRAVTSGVNEGRNDGRSRVGTAAGSARHGPLRLAQRFPTRRSHIAIRGNPPAQNAK